MSLEVGFFYEEYKTFNYITVYLSIRAYITIELFKILLIENTK